MAAILNVFLLNVFFLAKQDVYGKDSSNTSRQFGFFNNTSSVTFPGIIWDLNSPKEFTFRTCQPNGMFLRQTSNDIGLEFTGFALYLQNGTVVFEWKINTAREGGNVIEETHMVSMSVYLADNQQYTVSLKLFLGSIYLNVTRYATNTIHSVVVANSTYNHELLTAEIDSSDLVVGENFSGCLYAGPGVDFDIPNVQCELVQWAYCPLLSKIGCALDGNECFGIPCLNGGTCVDQLQNYRCECPRIFSGVNCEEDLARQYGCGVSPCENNGTCFNVILTDLFSLPYRCACIQGFTGVNCETVLNQCDRIPSPCGHGSCYSVANTFICNCSDTGFTGENCGDDIDECDGNPCGVGTCFNIPGLYICQCPPGFDGLHCQDVDECLSNPCKNNGTCAQAINNFTCDCPLGFRGHDCVEDIDECESIACAGEHQKCVDGVNSHSCVCQEGYQEISNECQEVDECLLAPCLHATACQDRINGYTCQCLPGYSGINCETDVDDCQDFPCFNNGTCQDGVSFFYCECPMGFTADNCGINIDDCERHVCRNSATCHDMVNEYRCECAVGWTGSLCDADIDECAANQCQNGATCTDLIGNYSCSCLAGFAGYNCEENIDDCAGGPCLNGGTCVDGIAHHRCECPLDFMGPNCSQQYDACFSDPCLNGAVCSTEKPQHVYNCSCVSGFRGYNCEENIDDCEQSSCLTFQQCFDMVDDYRCDCPVGFTGRDCLTDIDECASDPCQNGGTCQQYVGFYNCSCQQVMKGRHGYLSGYTGQNCEVDIDECQYQPPMCENNGQCNNDDGGYDCFCIGQSSTGDLFAGQNCDLVTSYCIVIGNTICQNGATCHNVDGGFHCDCAPGFTVCLCTDQNCSTDIDECMSEPCQYNGTCHDRVNGYNCLCIAGITGINCDVNVNDCETDQCGPGSCIDLINGYKCNCTDTGFTGETCEVNIDDCYPWLCQHNGTCLDGVKTYTCSCFAAFTGHNCETDINECHSSPCMYNGTCLELSDESLYGLGITDFPDVFVYANASGYVCQCISGFAGENCQVNIDDCMEGVCENGASCNDLINAFTCSCTPGYTGMYCRVDIDECALYSPCQHRSSCQDLVADYSCTCYVSTPPVKSYGGRNCSVYLSGCDGVVACQNGQCVPVLNNEQTPDHGYSCRCDPGFTGMHCDVPTVLSMGENSSLRRTLNVSDWRGFGFSFRFRSTLSEAVLAVLQIGRRTAVSVELEAGNIILAMKVGNWSVKKAVTTYRSAADESTWHFVAVELSDVAVTLSLVSEICRAERCQQQINHSLRFFAESFATINFGNTDALQHQTHTSAFIGCFEDIIVNNTYLFPAPPDNEYIGVQQGCHRVKQCKPYTCSRNGACKDKWDDFICECDRPHYGRHCEYEYSAATFNSSSMAVFNASFSPPIPDWMALNVSLFLQTRQEANSAVMFLLFDTRSSNRLPYITLELHAGRLAVRIYFCGRVSFYLGQHEPVNLGYQSLFSLRLDNRFIVMKLNHTTVVNESLTNFLACHSLMSSVYFGGEPPFIIAESGRRKRQILPPPPPPLSELSPFNGVLQDIEIQGVKLDFEEGVSSSQELSLVMIHLEDVQIGAHSTTSACNVGSPCQNGGTCHEKFFNDFRCECHGRYRGKHCNDHDYCEENSCPDNTRCQSLLFGFECISAASFNGSHGVSYRTDMEPSTVHRVSFMVRTHSLFGAILETVHGGYFLKVRMSGGGLEVSFLLSDTEFGFSSSFSSDFPINDGRWYHADIIFESSVIKLTVIHDGIIVDEDEARFFTYVSDVLQSLIYQSEVRVAYSATPTEQRFVGCLEDVRVDGILLSFVSNELTNNNIATPRFSVSAASLETGCDSSASSCAERRSLCGAWGRCQDTWSGIECTCLTGYSGRYCEWRQAVCNGQGLCQNGGTCVERIGTPTCICPASYTNVSCQTPVDLCANSSCVLGFACESDPNLTRGYTCNCLKTGFSGALCHVNISDRSCSDGLCGHSNNCSDTEIAHTDAQQPSFTCQCTAGYTGALCDSTINSCSPHPCNDGNCTTNITSPLAFTCHCDSGFSGDYCLTNINDCEGVNCSNGLCIDGIDSYRCECSTGWTGRHCSEDVAECDLQTCQHGECQELPGLYFCDCTGTGFEGVNCTSDVDECNGGFCLEANTVTCTNSEGGYHCNCSLGYRGDDCTEATCVDALCLNNSTCHIEDVSWGQQWVCHCVSFYGGQQCQLAGPCQSQPCNMTNTDYCEQDPLFYVSGHSSYTCHCKSNLAGTPVYTGRHCDQDVDECDEPTSCWNHTTHCVNTAGSFQCQCPPGDHCDNIYQCPSSPCLNGGLCSVRVGGAFQCNCSGTGFDDETCSVDVDECVAGKPCNNGTCVNKPGSYTCVCGEDYLGRSCEHHNPCSLLTCGDHGNCSYWQVNSTGRLQYIAACSCLDSFSGESCQEGADYVSGRVLFIVIPTATVLLLLLVICLTVFIMFVRGKRATRGVYSPNYQEKVCNHEMNSVLSKPIRERLI